MMSRARFAARLAGVLIASGGLTLGGCTSAYYSAMEQVGTHKRDILKSRIEAGQEDQQEVDSMQSAKLKGQSSRSLTDTRAKYTKLIAAMKKAEGKMPPVLTAFRDQVLFLKHNLNARAIASLSSTLGEIEGDIELLIKDIDASIAESERFLSSLESAS